MFVHFQRRLERADETLVAVSMSHMTVEGVCLLVGKVHDAVVQQVLEMACKLRELLNHQVLLVCQLNELFVVDGCQVKVSRVCLVIQ